MTFMSLFGCSSADGMFGGNFITAYHNLRGLSSLFLANKHLVPVSLIFHFYNTLVDKLLRSCYISILQFLTLSPMAV